MESVIVSSPSSPRWLPSLCEFSQIVLSPRAAPFDTVFMLSVLNVSMAGVLKSEWIYAAQMGNSEGPLKAQPSRAVF